MSTGFVRWELRTVDVVAARSFYDQILEKPALDVTAIPEMARERGARPLWLGHLAVADVPVAAAAFAARGAVELAGGKLLRDPSGAILALTSLREPARGDVLWTQLFTGDPERAKRDYAELFGMSFGPRLEVPGHGTFDQFGWESGPITGSIRDIGDEPHVHPHWLFFFRVRDLVRAMACVKENGGTVIVSTTLPGVGQQVAVCDDPQGAAFALMQRDGQQHELGRSAPPSSELRILLS